MLGYNSVEELDNIDLNKEGFAPGFTRQDFRKILEQEGEVIGLEYKWEGPNNKTFHAKENAKVIKDENGNTLYYEGSIEDISDKKIAEEKLTEYTIELQRSNQELQDFASITSHDLKEPLRKITTLCDRLKESDNQLDEQGKLYLDRMSESAKRLQRLIEDILEYSSKVIEDLKSKGTNVYFIPAGGANSIGTLGYVECLNEIIRENNKYNFSQIVHATGSSGTQAGLLAGRKYFNCNIPVTGISVRFDKKTQEEKVYSLAKKTCEMLQCNTLDKSEVVVYDDYIGSGYGEPTDGMIEATKLLAKKEAILLDPVYSGKGFAGLIGLIKNKKFTKNDNVLFIHTGGAVSLFAYEWAFNK